MPTPSKPRRAAAPARTDAPTPSSPLAPEHPTPTGSPPAETRIERDSLGEVAVPAQALWGAQTQRSLHHFAIGAQPMPARVVRALAWVKWAAARAHADLQQMPADKAQAIADAAWAVAAGEHALSFPLSVWQTGSGTQSNMNVNEVIAHLASQALGGGLGDARTVHPNDEVNRGQSSNDVFPTAMHLAAALAVRDELLPALDALHGTLAGHAERWADIVKVGRTHGQDATPITLGQAFSALAAQLALARQGILHALPALHQLAIGGTAVGTGLNTHPDFGARVCALLAQQHDLPLRQAANLFAAMAGHEALAALHGSLRTLAVALMKIGNDIRLLGSGPRAGLGELSLPANEPGSSIMPGKVNPTQVEALTMVCAQVMGHDVAVGIGASQGQFELNAYKPLIIHNVLDSLQLLSDAMLSFDAHCARGLQPVPARIEELLSRSLMLVTALTPHIGYDRAARIAKQAHEQGGTLRDAALADGVAAADFDTWVDPHKMLSPRA